jgi:hypothetical protein
MKHLFLILAALVSGAVGGSIGTYAVLVHETGQAQRVVRAHRFELINDGGQTISFWGADPGGYVELAFGEPQEAPASRNRSVNDAVEGTSAKDRQGRTTQSIAIGLEGETKRPFLSYHGTDDQLRVLLDLDDFERPSLQMSDGKVLGLTLGSERSDTPGYRDKTERWALNFLPDERALIGAYTKEDRAGIDVRGFFRINPARFQYQH